MNVIELKLFIGLSRTAARIDRRTSQIAKRYGLSFGQFAVLEALYHKGDLTIGQVQEKILSTTGTIPVIIGNLEKKGLLSRCPDCNDRRKCILHLTDAGKSLFDQLFPENQQMIVDSMQCWTEAEKQELLRLLKKFRDANADQGRAAK